MTTTSSGKVLKFLTRSNTSSCARACANNNECDAFSVDKRHNCRLQKSGELRRVNKGIAGFCPKSKSVKAYRQKEFCNINLIIIHI